MNGFNKDAAFTLQTFVAETLPGSQQVSSYLIILSVFEIFVPIIENFTNGYTFLF